MQDQKAVSIPKAAADLFHNGIDHPELWLWDSWTYFEQGTLHLYCLALAKTDPNGSTITPPERNDYPFHIRHFSSTDHGHSWRDQGPVIQPGNSTDGADERNVWSGSVTRLASGQMVFGYTGVRQLGSDRNFLQTICASFGSDAHTANQHPNSPLSCPLRDYDAITAAGYYLGPKDRLGDNTGEDGGPIMCWRDPYFFYDLNNQLTAVWSAKVGPTQPAIATATFREEHGALVLADLLAPVTLPDDNEFTQAEVPKIYIDKTTSTYYLIISACNRVFEGQPDSEVNQELRLYSADQLSGPWQPCSARGSLLHDLNFLFGASIIAADFADSRITLLGPRTENAGPTKQLKFDTPIDVKFA